MSNSSKIVIFDIDGTLADTSKRIHYMKAEKKNWTAFYAEAKHDDPHKHVVNLTKMYLNAGYHIILLTGRPANLKQDTLNWLNKEGVLFHVLLMRLIGDHGKDNVVKRETLISYLVNNNLHISQIEAVYEDRIHVAETWREMGLSVFLVGDEWREVE